MKAMEKFLEKDLLPPSCSGSGYAQALQSSCCAADQSISIGSQPRYDALRSSCCAVERIVSPQPDYDALKQSIITVEQANAVISTFTHAELLQVLKKIMSEDNILRFVPIIAAVQQLTATSASVDPDGLIDAAEMREIAAQEDVGKVQETLKLVRIAFNVCGIAERWFRQISKLLGKQTFSRARGAAECQMLVHRWLVPYKFEFEEIVKKANQCCRDVVMLRIRIHIVDRKRGMVDLKNSKDLDEGISAAYSGELSVAFEENIDLRSQLKQSYHKWELTHRKERRSERKRSGSSRFGFKSANQIANVARGYPRAKRLSQREGRHHRKASDVANFDQDKSVAFSSAAPDTTSSSSATAASSSSNYMVAKPMYICQLDLDGPRGLRPEHDRSIGPAPRRRDPSCQKPLAPVSIPPPQTVANMSSAVNQKYPHQQHQQCNSWNCHWTENHWHGSQCNHWAENHWHWSCSDAMPAGGLVAGPTWPTNH